jgi:hypothetical protein
MIDYLKTRCTVRPAGAYGRVVLDAGAEVIQLTYNPSRREWDVYAVGPDGLASFVAKRKPNLRERRGF